MAISLKCSCGKTLKVDDKHRGKKAKCPECGALLLVEEQDAETGVQAEKPKKRPVDDDGVKSGKPSKRADPDDDDDDDLETRKPIKKKAKSSMTTWLVAGGCGLLMLFSCCGIGGGAGVWYFFFTGSGDDLAFVQDGAAGFVSIRAADIWKSTVVQDQIKQMDPNAKKAMDDKLKEMEAKGDMKIDDLERMTFIIRSADMMNKPDFAIVLKTSKNMDRKKIIDAMGKEKNDKAKEVKHDRGTIFVFGGGPDAMAVFFVSDRVVLMGEKEDTIKDMLKSSQKPAKNPALTRGIKMAAAGRHQIVAAFEVKKDLMGKMMPGGGGGGLNVANLQKTNGVIIAGTLAKDLALEAVLTFDTSDAAGKAKSDVDGLVAMAKLFGGGGGKMPTAATKFMDSLKVEQQGADVVVKANLELDLKAFGGMIPFGMGGGGGPGGGGPMGGGPGRITSVNNLKQIALAMHSFHDANRSLPNHAIRDSKTGAPLLSWRVTLLPYLDQAPLYKQIHLNEPWNSPHNSQFHKRMPRVYLMPGRPNDGRTFYKVFYGNESAFPKSNRPPNQTLVSGIGLANIADGTTNTILVVETADSVNWMEPNDIPFQKNDPALPTRMGNHWGNNTFLAAMADGRVETMRRTLTMQTLQGLVTRGGGEVVRPKDYQP